METGYKKILIINLGGMGDVLLSTPSLRAIRHTYPYAEISALTSQAGAEVMNCLSYIDRVHIFYINYGGKVDIFRNISTLFSLRKERFNLAVNMRTLVSKKSAVKMRFMLDLIGPERKAGRDTNEMGRFFDISIPEKNPGEKYEMEYDIDLAEALGCRVLDRHIDFEIDRESIRKIDAILEREGISQEDIVIGVHPGGMPSRRWPLENFSEFIREMNKKVECRFIITGGRDEVNLAETLIEIIGTGVTGLAGRLSIKELGALIERCNLYISNDTGPMHIAAILKTPLVAIFGPGDIVRFDPRNISDKTIVLYQRVECAPCEITQCESLKCLKAISPEDVVDASMKLIRVCDGRT